MRAEGYDHNGVDSNMRAEEALINYESACLALAFAHAGCSTQQVAKRVGRLGQYVIVRVTEAIVRIKPAGAIVWVHATERFNIAYIAYQATTKESSLLWCMVGSSFIHVVIGKLELKNRNDSRMH